MATFGSVNAVVDSVRRIAEPYARSAAALIAGLAITFTQDHSTYTGLFWLTAAVIVSLIVRDGPTTVLNKAAWWSTVVVVAMTSLGLLVGKMSTMTALSLTIALVAFETSRAFTRGDRIWLWSTGVLAVALSILYFSVDSDDTTAAGLTGGWAVIAGVFGLIAAIDRAIKSSRKHVATPATSSPATKKPAAKKDSPSTRTKPKATPRGTKR